MAQTTVYKPSTISKKGGIAFLVDQSGSQNPPTATLKDGRKITARYYNTNEGRIQFLFPPELANEKDFTISYDGKTTTIGSGATSYEGSDFSNLQARSKGSLGSSAGSGPRKVGDYAFAPEDLSGEFPATELATYDPIKAADYKYTDPFKLTEKIGVTNRNQIKQNYGLSKEMGLDAVNTELQGLLNYAPAAAALQQGLVNADNEFNQAQRTRQVDTALPGVRASLEGQAGRATSYANGRIPDLVQDRALELGIRSGAADRASAGGFGVNSSAASKASDLMSAEERVKLSQYGDQLLTGNINQKAGLFLAPTEYANAGSQIRVNPTVDAASRAQNYQTQLNAATTLDPNSTLNNVTQQRQFATNLNQQTNQFNATNKLNLSQFNATAQNQANQTLFQYKVGLAGAEAGAEQTNINTGIEIKQQQDAKDAANQAKKDTQKSNTIKDIIGGAVGIGTAIINALGGKETAGNNNIETSINGISDSLDSADKTLADPNSSLNTTPEFQIDNKLDFGSGVTIDRPSNTGPTYDSGLSDLSNPVALSARAQIPRAEAVKLASFQKDTGVSLSRVSPKALAATAKGLVTRSTAVLKAAGISNTPIKNGVQAGYDTQGKPIYVDRALATSNNINVGRDTIAATRDIIKPFNLFKGEDIVNFDKIAEIASNPSFIKGLDDMHISGSASDFVKTLNQAISSINKAPQKLPAKVQTASNQPQKLPAKIPARGKLTLSSGSVGGI